MLIFDLIRKNTSNAKYNSELTTLQQINDSMTRCGYIPFYSVDDLLEEQNGGYMPSFDVFINLSLDHIEQHYKEKKSMVFSDLTNSIPSLIDDIFGEEQLPPDEHMFKVTHKSNKITSKSTKCPTPCDTKLSANTKIYSNCLTLEITGLMSSGGTGYIYEGKATDKGQFFIVKEFFSDNFRNSVKRDPNGNLLINDNINAEFMRLKEQFISTCKFHEEVCASGNMHILQQYDFFEANNTAYAIYHSLKGKMLRQFIKNSNTLHDEQTAYGGLRKLFHIGRREYLPADLENPESSAVIWRNAENINLKVKRYINMVLRLAEALEPIHKKASPFGYPDVRL